MKDDSKQCQHETEPTLIATLNYEEDKELNNGQTLYFYDDGTYNGIMGNSGIIDHNITLFWRINEEGNAQFRHNRTCDWRDFDTCNELFCKKVAEYYLLKSETN